MIKQKFIIEGIPAILWGDHKEKIFIAVHGNMSHKEDEVIVQFAEKAAEAGYQILSFDLPEHGERKNEETLCKVQNCEKDLIGIMKYVRGRYENISLFACSMGAYFSLLAYENEKLNQALFLSPVVNMEKIIENMMLWFNVSKDELERKKEIATPVGQVLYWDYYCYVKSNPVSVWNVPTSVLYGSKDEVTEYDIISEFTEIFSCDLMIMENGEHYFHTKEQMDFFNEWLNERLYINKINI